MLNGITGNRPRIYIFRFGKSNRASFQDGLQSSSSSSPPFLLRMILLISPSINSTFWVGFHLQDQLQLLDSLSRINHGHDLIGHRCWMARIFEYFVVCGIGPEIRTLDGNKGFHGFGYLYLPSLLDQYPPSNNSRCPPPPPQLPTVTSNTETLSTFNHIFSVFLV